MSDISPILNFTNLTYLNLSGNNISSIQGLENLTNLETLYLWHNQIENIEPLKYLTNLQMLSLLLNNVKDIKPLVENPGIGDGDWIILTGCPLNETSVNTYIPQLKQRGVIVIIN